ncbi:kinase-like domain-containing protein [Durotheca rogersii]|uniref:kinase-like domain-containing protein n=1 Tax=Durotheca rogersii TaxID=419775 RepID=UPI0022210874|nr:kinase-like domain-containing protein [Durotheca rogersii]KAI5859410.1 kinase-like domain-containing protein [Durotheca rogersii]
MQEKIFCYAKFNVDALLALAEKLRGRPCTCDVSKPPKAGSLNWVIFVSFDDGIDWVFRSPRTGPSTILTDETASKMLVSEASTLKYLRAHCSIPVPEVYSYSGSKDNDVGVPYILQSKASGRALSDYDWADCSREPSGYKLPWPLLPLSDHDRQNIMRQLGAIMSRLSEIRFEQIGSIFEDRHGNFSIGECLSPSLLWQWRDSIEEAIDRGPFSEEGQYLNSLISAFTSHAKELYLTPHTFFAPIPDSLDYPTWDSYRAAARRWNDFVAIGNKIESSKNRLSYCIAGQFLHNMIPHLSSTANGGFTLSHPDLHSGNIFVDEDLNITCIIDWGSATSGPITELLTTPGLAGSASPPSRSQITAFRSCFNLGVPKIDPDVWKKADRMWYFSRLVRLLSKQDYNLFKTLYELVYEIEDEGAVGSVDYARLFHEQAQQEGNKQLFAKLREDDASEEEVKEREEAAFRLEKKKKSNSLAVARKLTLMSEMNPGFVADKRLWRWIGDALGQVDSV